MLWMLAIFGIGGILAMIGMNIQARFDDFYSNLDCNKESIRENQKNLIIFIIIAVIGIGSLNTIYSSTHYEVSKTSEGKLLAFTTSGEISEQGSYYIHNNIDTNIYTFFYMDNNHIVKIESDHVARIEGYNGIPYVEEYTTNTNENILYYILTFDKESQKSYVIYNVSENEIQKTTKPF